MKRLIPVELVLGALLLPSAGWADGFVFRTTGVATDSLATAQRALVWHRSGVWEVHIQPEFDRAEGGAAWVVPFPVRPTVVPGSAELLDQLEYMTAPLFVERCRVPCCPGEMCDGGLPEQWGEGDVSVTVWESGTVGDLDYVVLSAAAGESLVGWLSAQGYALPAGADLLLAALDTEGLFFFASRLSAGVDPDRPLVPVRFILPDLDRPHYPLRLTALGAPSGQALDLTVWLVYTPGPEEEGYLPSSHPYGVLDEEGILEVEQFRAGLDAFFAGHEDGTFLLLYGRRFPGSPHRELCNSYGFCDPYYDPDAPEWVPEIWEMAGGRQMMQRWHARLGGAAMAEDLDFAPAAAVDIPQPDNVYVDFTGDCFTCSVEDQDVGTDDADDSGDAGADAADPDEPDAGCACGVAASPSPGWVGLLGLCLAGLAFRRHRR